MLSSQSIRDIPPHDLGNGLIVRPSTQQDANDLLLLVGTVFNTMLGEEGGDTHMTHLVRRVMSGMHPSMCPEDFIVVEDTRRTQRRIVGCTGFLHHTWEYEGIPFTVGRPEVIATYPEYRSQGLIRATFAMMHARSAAQGHSIQAITGIPYYYRLFDYEYALDLWHTCTINVAHMPEVPESLSELYTVCDATIEDIPLIQKLYEDQRSKGMISQNVDKQWWNYQIQSWSANSQQNINSHIQMLVSLKETKGYIITSAPQIKRYMQIWDLQVTDDVNLQEAMPAILHNLYVGGVQERAHLQQDGSLNELRFMLGETHAAFYVLKNMNANVQKNAYAWYIRVSDIPAFLLCIAPVLEARLVNASIRTFQGELKLDFYRSGLHLVFENGHLVQVEAWQQNPERYVKADAGFPPNVFLQMLFGRRSFAELSYIFPDVWVKDERVELLLQILFPQKLSWVLPVW